MGVIYRGEGRRVGLVQAGAVALVSAAAAVTISAYVHRDDEDPESRIAKNGRHECLEWRTPEDCAICISERRWLAANPDRGLGDLTRAADDPTVKVTLPWLEEGPPADPGR